MPSFIQLHYPDKLLGFFKLKHTRLPSLWKYHLWMLCFIQPIVLHAQELPFTHYTTENEVNPLPSSAITRVFQDHLGYIWIAAYGAGLVRYDGNAFKSYGYDDSLKTRAVWALTEDMYGRLWVGSDDGLFVSETPLSEYTDTDRIKFASRIGAVSLHDGIIQSKNALTTDRSGRIWFSPRGDKLIRYQPSGPGRVAADTILIPPATDGSSGGAVALTSRRDGSTWVSLKGGRMLVMEGKATGYTILEDVPCPEVNTLYESHSGTLWGGCRNGSIWKLTEENGGRNFANLKTPYAGMVTAIMQDSSGMMWVSGLGGGLMRMHADASHPVIYSRKQGLLDENIWDIIQDREGNYWIAQNSGLSKLRVDFEAFTHYTGNSHAGERPALPAPDVDSVLPPFTINTSAKDEDTLSLLVAGTPGGAALIKDDGTIVHLTADQGLSSNIVLSLCRDEKQGIWIGTRDGVNQLTFGEGGGAGTPPGASQQRTLFLFGKKAHLARFNIGQVNSCNALALPIPSDSARTEEAVCFASRVPVRCLAGNNWFSFGTASGLPEDDFWTLGVDEQGYVLAGAQNEGFYRSTIPLSIALLDKASRLEREQTSFPVREVTAPIFRAVSDGAGSEKIEGFSSTVWVRQVLWGVGDEIVVLEGVPLGVSMRLDLEHGFDANPESIAYSPQTKTIWVGTERGLAEIDPGSRAVVRWITKLDGLVGNVVWGPGAVAVGADGTIYFATSTGLSLYRPHLDQMNMLAPAPRLRSMRFTEDPNGNNELNLEYASLSFANEKKVRYKTRLRGFGEDWSPEKIETSVRYTNLGAFLFPRIYTFEVIAANEDGLWSVNPLTYPIAVRPAWWLRWWAFLFYITLAAAGLFLVDRVQRRRLISREREESLMREKELRADAAEAWANYLQAENQRQTLELEQARQLQLSMLPEKVPVHPMVEIVAYMKTATEVGGDYYDFHLAEDDTLTLAIGDATGHGLLAGTMVTAMKSLWNAFAAEPELEEVLLKSGRVLKQMKLPKLYMALALARLRMPVIEFTGAGMPPALLYRAATRKMEAIPLKGIPLGGPGAVSYRIQCVTLYTGDTIVLMSDGFPELRNTSGEFLGYDFTAEIFAEVADRSPTAIITHLKEKVNTWCDGQRPNDDVTFLVIKVK